MAIPGDLYGGKIDMNHIFSANQKTSKQVLCL